MENLSYICGGLGIIEEDDDGNHIGYTPGEYCLDNLKDLVRFLRRDDPETRQVFKQVCKWNIVGKHVLPIVQYCQNDSTLLLNAVKVLVFLTMPIDPTSKDIPQQIEYLWNLKSLITASHAIPVIVTLLETPLQHLQGDDDMFTEDDWKLVQLLLTLFRNILAVQDITTQQRAAGSASEYILLRDRFLQLLFEENVMELILLFTQHVGGQSSFFRQDNLLLLETFYYIYKAQLPELIAKAHLDAAHIKVEGDAEATAADLKSLMEEEKAKRRQIIFSNLGSRSNFTGSFTRLTMDGSKVLVKGNPCSDSHDSLLKGHTKQFDPTKKMLWDSGRMPTTNKNILRLLYDFTNQFLLGGYNVLMQSIRVDIEKEHHAIENSDVVAFFQVAEFVMSFQNQKLLSSRSDAKLNKSESSKDHHGDSTLFRGSMCGSISETMNESMFLLVISKWRSAFEGLKETNNYKFLSAAGSLTKIMIRMLDLVLKSSPEDSKELQTARVLLYKLFYDQTDQGMTYFLFNLIKAFNAHKQPKSDLADLVETIHIVMRLMENLQSRGTLRVAKKSRKKRKKKASTVNKDNNNVDQDAIQNKNSLSEGEKGECVSNPVEEIPKGSNDDKNGDDDIFLGESIPKGSNDDKNGGNDIVPGESILKGSNDDKNGDDDIVPGESIPKGSNGDGDIVPGESDQPDAPMLETEDIECNVSQMDNEKSENATASVSADATVHADADADTNVNDNENANANVDANADDDYVSDASSDEQQEATNEVDFKASSLVTSLANNTIIQNLCWLLKFYKNNSVRTNHYIICALRRICEDLELSPVLYQLSLLIIFHTILEEQKSNPCKEYENIVSFLSSLVRRMLGKMKSYPLLFVELLFWKTRKECHYINCESMLQDLGKMRNEYRNKGDDPPHGDLGDVGTSGRNVWVKRSLADALGDDEADVVIPPWRGNDDNEGNHGEVQIQKTSKNTNVGLGTESIDVGTGTLEEFDNEHPKRARKRLKPLVLDDAGEEKLKGLYEKYKDFPDCRHRIVVDLNLEVSPAQISNKLKQMGLKFPSKRRMGDKDVAHVNGTNAEASLQQPSVVRKRVRAFSEDQEMKIKTLFEQFKDQKKCSQMIASALDDDGKFTAAQISRKLRQLGLRIRKQKSDNMHLRDEDDNNAPTETDSDGETLLSLKKRSKKQNVVSSEETPDQNTDQLSNDVDNIVLSSAFRSKKNQNIVPSEQTPDQNTDQLLDDDDDDIVLSSAFRKGSKRLSQAKTPEIPSDSINHKSSEVEAEVIKDDSGQQEDVMMSEKPDEMQDGELIDDFADELTDFGNNAGSPVTSQHASGSRRKLRMIIDPEDED
nr:hypothetical protein [Tanacetum cinerariifolium]